jgi:potassium-transporting ATPase KdpC subunit
MLKLLIQSARQTILWTVITGMLYPLVITVIAQLAFHDQANGSLVTRDGKIIGSGLLAQQFQGSNYFWPRPSAATYATVPSGASNLGPTSGTLQTNVMNYAAALRSAHNLPTNVPVPADLVFTSASGVDPHISPEAARFQIARVAAARGMSEDRVKALVEQFIEPPQWGFLGEARVNVLLLNVALDQSDNKKADNHKAEAATVPNG